MADSEIENNLGLTDKRKVQGSTGRHPGGAVPIYNDVARLRDRLVAINGTYYTSTRLNSMTKNDMVHAVRQNDDAAGI